jgi:hypothetical protein
LSGLNALSAKRSLSPLHALRPVIPALCPEAPYPAAPITIRVFSTLFIRISLWKVNLSWRASGLPVKKRRPDKPVKEVFLDKSQATDCNSLSWG